MLESRDLASLCQSGLLHLQACRLEDAERDFRGAIAQAPNHAPGLLALGVIAWQRRHYEIAHGYACRLLVAAPGAAAHHLLLARVLRDWGRGLDAVAPFRVALRQNPEDNGARFELAALLADLGQLEGACLCYRTVLRHDPALAAGHFNLGNLLVRRGRHAEAATCFEAAMALDPGNPDTQNNLADALRRAGRVTAAEEVYQRLANAHPAMADAHYNLGTLWLEAERFVEAAAAFRTTLRLQPDHPNALNNLGGTLIETGDYPAAVACLQDAAARQPTLPTPLTNLGSALREVGRTEAAQACFDQALRLAPEYLPARYNLATTLLQNGELAEGWPLYETRWQTMLTPRPFKQPRWQGEPLGEQVLLLHAEQGIGDTLQFCRFAEEIARSTRIVLEVQRPLLRLLTRSIPQAGCIVASGDALPAFDRHCPLLSLPLVRGTTLSTIPADIPYVTPDPDEAGRWRERLARLPGVRVGLVWQGNQRYAEMRRKRDLPTGQLAALAGIPGISFISLQKELPPDACGMIPEGLQMHDWTAELNDFAQTAALVANLDLVIGVDTSVIHLAGALGRPVWLLNRFDPCWRWLREREDSPWYPSLRQFRQSAPGGWADVMARVRDALAGHAVLSSARLAS